MLFPRLLFALLLLCSFLRPAIAGPWLATLYAGPVTKNNSSQIFLHGDFHVDGGMSGLAVFRHLARLCAGFTPEEKGQLTRFAFGRNSSNVAPGLGIRDSDFPWIAPTSIALHTGHPGHPTRC
jgi:hypothetical protein